MKIVVHYNCGACKQFQIEEKDLDFMYLCKDCAFKNGDEHIIPPL